MKSDPSPPGPKHAAMYATVLSSYDPAAEAAAKTAEKIARAKESLEQQAANKAKIAKAHKARSDNAGISRRRREEIVKKHAAAHRKAAGTPRADVSWVARCIWKKVNAELPPKERSKDSRPVEDIMRRLKL